LTAAIEARSGSSAGDLRARAAAIADDRARRAAEKAEGEKRAREAEKRRLRALRIKHLAERGEAAWDDLERHIAMRYALAAALLADLRDSDPTSLHLNSFTPVLFGLNQSDLII
jgi:hypothetical protein